MMNLELKHRMRLSPRRLAAGLLGTVLILPAANATAQGQQGLVTDGIMKPEGVDVVARAVPRSWDRPEIFGAPVITPPLPVEGLLAEDGLLTQLGPVRTGVVQQFDPVASDGDGEWTQLEDGGWLWTASFFATGAVGVRLHVEPFTPPLGAELIVYAPGKPDAVRGPITGSYQPYNELWTPTIYGSEEIRLEYYLPPHVDFDDPNVHIVVTELLNDYRTVGGGPLSGGSLPCNLDVMCFGNWEFVSRGVGPISFVGNQFGFFCSSSMMNRIGGDFTPLLATAFHCGVNAGNAPSLLVTWFYRTNVCNGTEPDLNTLPQTQGVALLVNNNANDYTLVGMSSANTGGVVWEGWDAGGWGNNSACVGIHHPRGDSQKITFGTQTGTWGSCIGGADAGWAIQNPNNNGELEPGSSGSPLFDAAGRVRGTASCANWGCNQDNQATYGRFNQAWPVLEPWLNPTDPIYLDANWGGSERGTQANPFNTVVEGVFAVLRNSTIWADNDVYNTGGLRIDKAMTIRTTGGLVRIQ